MAWSLGPAPERRSGAELGGRGLGEARGEQDDPSAARGAERVVAHRALDEVRWKLYGHLARREPSHPGRDEDQLQHRLQPAGLGLGGPVHLPRGMPPFRRRLHVAGHAQDQCRREEPGRLREARLVWPVGLYRGGGDHGGPRGDPDVTLAGPACDQPHRSLLDLRLRDRLLRVPVPLSRLQRARCLHRGAAPGGRSSRHRVPVPDDAHPGHRVLAARPPGAARGVAGAKVFEDARQCRGRQGFLRGRRELGHILQPPVDFVRPSRSCEHPVLRNLRGVARREHETASGSVQQLRMGGLLLHPPGEHAHTALGDELAAGVHLCAHGLRDRCAAGAPRRHRADV
mmetsp:Transcript_82179/g.238266  ORF Transcript_82179/g.238266 Transcript_82179/m.238266 type:complete len:342 (-) Transcript_82179:603-1628(-)